MTTPYKLADGVLLIDEPPLFRIFDIKTKRTIVADFRQIPFLKSLATGNLERHNHPALKPLMELGLIEKGKPAVDSIVLNALRKIESQPLSNHSTLYDQILRQYATEKCFSLSRFSRKANPANTLQRAQTVHQYLNEKPSTLFSYDAQCVMPLQFFGHTVHLVDTKASAENLATANALVIETLPTPTTLGPLLTHLLCSAPTKIPIFMPITSDLAPIMLEWLNRNSMEALQWHPQAVTYCHPYSGTIAFNADFLVLQKQAHPHNPLADDVIVSPPYNDVKAPGNSKGYIGSFEYSKNPRFAQPLFLDTLLNTFFGIHKLKFQTNRYLHQDWTYIACDTTCHRLRLYANRHAKTIQLELSPFDPDLEKSLRELLFSAFELTITSCTLLETPHYWLLTSQQASTNR